jgi:monoterpene epsilon-lactone hydrolase
MTEGNPLDPVRERILAISECWASGMTLDEIRESFDAFMEEAGPDGAASARPEIVQGCPVPAVWIGEGPLHVLYCHGGGFQIGGVRSHASLMSRIARKGGARVLGVDYRRAPEHRYPASEEDVIEAYGWMVGEGHIPDAVIGDSAGGTLALRIAIRARESGLPLPKSLVLISPWLDLSLRGASYTDLADADIFSQAGQLKAMARSYLGRGRDPADPEVSPVYGDLRGLPPILVHAGSCDITLDDSFLLARRAAEQGSTVRLRVFEGMCHHFQAFEDLTESDHSLAEIGAFVKAHAVRGT